VMLPLCQQDAPDSGAGGSMMELCGHLPSALQLLQVYMCYGILRSLLQGSRLGRILLDKYKESMEQKKRETHFKHLGCSCRDTLGGFFHWGYLR
jgi:hypothetical protein